MQLGIFAKTFAYPTLEEVLDAVALYGLTHVQFNMSCVGLPTLPERIPNDLCARIAGALRERGLTMAAISGTFNLLRPREAEIDYFKRIEALAACCPRLGTRTITLCTGTLDPDDMWRRHPGNDSPEAWSTLVANMKTLAEIADRHEVIMAFEPEVANVVDSARKARRLLDEVRSPWLKVVIDPVNLFRAEEGDYREVFKKALGLDKVFELLGSAIVLAHVKDLTVGPTGSMPHELGLFIFRNYLRLLLKHGYDGPLILHGLTEAEVESSVDILRTELAKLSGGGAS
jgi:sugar phosphate isomerase/epimerase